MNAALVEQVKSLQRSDPSAKEFWGSYTTSQGGGTRDPNKHTAEFLQGFIDQYNAGGAAAFQGMGAGAMGGAMGAGGWGGGDDGSVEGLAAKVKEMQRSNANAKEQWTAFTDLNGAGRRDPSKHTPEFLQGFIDHIQSGHQINPSAAAGNMENPGLGDAFKLLQKKSESFKNHWRQFCTTQGGGRFDPSKHDTAFHMCFIEHISSLASGGAGSAYQGGGMGGGGMMGPMGASAAPFKMMRNDSGMGMGMGASGDPMKDGLINRVKAFQRAGTEQKELWATYVDTYLGGARDPTRHDASTLHEFCTNHGVP